MAVAATGFFDGVHSGHRTVVGKMLSIAAAKNEESLVVTFWPHPKTVLSQCSSDFRLLTTLQEKLDIFASCGVDRVEVLPFSRDFSLLPAREFVKEYLAERFGVTTLVVGYDHRLGHDSFETVERMMDVISSCGIEPVKVERIDGESGTVSSSAIRKALLAGDVDAAAGMLGYRYSVQGTLKASGGCFEFVPERSKLLPADGDYEVKMDGKDAYCKIKDGIVSVFLLSLPSVNTKLIF